MPAPIHIASRAIGPNQPCYIIAEVGVNHNGDLDLAKQLIVEAKRAGADCVKFQTFKAERVATANVPKAQYQLQTTPPTESQLEMLRKLELKGEYYPELLALCTHEGIGFLSTPYSSEDTEFLARLGAEAFKIASALLIETEFVGQVARYGKPIILSTGMATLAEVDNAVRTIRKNGNNQIILMQCTTNYPSQIGDANLRAMQTMAIAFDLPVGYSDHTLSTTACVLSIGLGACIVEKHFTIDKSLPGPDQSTSANVDEFRQLVVAIRDAEAALGNGRKEPSEAERVNMIGMRRSIVAREFIPAGATITSKMLISKRPATGISPSELMDVLGTRSIVPIEADEILEWGMLERPANRNTYSR